jgi:hypothetical protein
MKCDEFQQQFQRFLDRRDRLPNRQMREHADLCASCRYQLQLWQRIETSLASESPHDQTPINIDSPVKASRSSRRVRQRPTIRGGSLVAAATAACLTVIIAMHRTSDPNMDTPRLTSMDTSQTELGTIEPSIGLHRDPFLWWNELRDREWNSGDWVSRTLPTVRIVSDGVAPLGRSIQRAATLLTTATREQTS